MRAMTQRLKSWDSFKNPNFEKFTSTSQISSVLQRNLLCKTSLIEDLLYSDFEYVIAARFQSDPVKCRFGLYHQMSGRRILILMRLVEKMLYIVKVLSKLKSD